MDRREMIQSTMAGLGASMCPEYQPELVRSDKPVMIRVRANNPVDDYQSALEPHQRKQIVRYVKKQIEGTPLECCAVFVCDGILADVEVLEDPRE